MSLAEPIRYETDPAPRRAACGGVVVRVAGTRATLRGSGALWLAASRTLVVADLHFEKGSAYGVRGQLLPPYDTRATLDRLEREVEALAPATLVFLGDSFHDGRAEARLARDDAARIAALASTRTLVWAVGNHDADGPVELPGEVVDDLSVEGLLLTHEPRPGRAPGEVAGHLHPCAKVVRYGRSVRRRCFLTDGERLVLPAFGAYAGGLNALDQAFAGLFARFPLVAALGERVHVLGPEVLSGD
ncbi:ligase-associated DNA damage response endonuclease PdeM [Caulobacter sp. 17J80-11]|uniref:ligase-associated DNA damage response endonuclease PdeM n=1 Tax=Caulobacter sp. 17J80-11 TaxID=2763502 RepID=UPI00351C49A6